MDTSWTLSPATNMIHLQQNPTSTSLLLFTLESDILDDDEEEEEELGTQSGGDQELEASEELIMEECLG